MISPRIPEYPEYCGIEGHKGSAGFVWSDRAECVCSMEMSNRCLLYCSHLCDMIRGILRTYRDASVYRLWSSLTRLGSDCSSVSSAFSNTGTDSYEMPAICLTFSKWHQKIICQEIRLFILFFKLSAPWHTQFTNNSLKIEVSDSSDYFKLCVCVFIKNFNE